MPFSAPLRARPFSRNLINLSNEHSLSTSSVISAERHDVALQKHHAGALPARRQRLARVQEHVGSSQLPALCSSIDALDEERGCEQEQDGVQHSALHFYWWSARAEGANEGAHPRLPRLARSTTSVRRASRTTSVQDHNERATLIL